MARTPSHPSSTCGYLHACNSTTTVIRSVSPSTTSEGDRWRKSVKVRSAVPHRLPASAAPLEDKISAATSTYSAAQPRPIPGRRG